MSNATQTSALWKDWGQAHQTMTAKNSNSNSNSNSNLKPKPKRNPLGPKLHVPFEPYDTILPTNLTDDLDCDGFDHGDTSPAKNVTSVFNCNSDSGTCKWFYPAKFLHQCGIGKKFIPTVNELKNLYNSQTLWLGGPPIVIPWVSIQPEHMRTSPYHNGAWVRHNISMTHVHKTGGTSLVGAFSSLKSKGGKGYRHTLYMPGKSNKTKIVKGMAMTTKGTKSMTYGPQFVKTAKFLDGAVKYRKEWGPHDHTLLAVVRDPAERFISAVGQATGALGSTTNGIGPQLLSECLKSTTQDTLRCFINLVKTNSTWIEVHFTPMALEIAFATVYKDIPVAAFPFEEVPSLMRELGANPDSKRKDGHQSGYRKDPILTNMNMSDYDDDMMKDLCEVYEMDALFLHHIGMSSSCDAYIQSYQR